MSRKMKTDWFPPNIKPVHVGWYESDYIKLHGNVSAWSKLYWDGQNWLWGPNGNLCMFKHRWWRGSTMRFGEKK
jgi:hypothetical protein